MVDLSIMRRSLLTLRDAIAPSSRYRVRIGGTVLINDGGTFPRVRVLTDSQALMVPGVTEGSIVYAVRVVSQSPVAMGSAEISIDGGTTWRPCRILGSARRDAGNDAWIIRLEQGANRG